jgi:DNA-binding transcriptional MerR regulator
MDEKNYKSIGEVLGLLLDEFPDVTISKIRFLESQGLIEPERTPSGYRKFRDSEVERLRFILREQRENYLPLKVIRTRLDNDTSDGMVRPYDDTDPTGVRGIVHQGSHPAAAKKLSSAPLAPHKARAMRDDTLSIDRGELLLSIDMDEKLLKEIIAAGIVTPRKVGELEMFSPLDREVLEIVRKFSELGIDVRNLKTLKRQAEAEVSMYETKIQPIFMRKNPTSKAQAEEMLDDLIELGEQLRSTLVEVAARSFRGNRQS